MARTASKTQAIRLVMSLLNRGGLDAIPLSVLPAAGSNFISLAWRSGASAGRQSLSNQELFLEGQPKNFPAFAYPLPAIYSCNTKASEPTHIHHGSLTASSMAQSA